MKPRDTWKKLGEAFIRSVYADDRFPSMGLSSMYPQDVSRLLKRARALRAAERKKGGKK